MISQEIKEMWNELKHVYLLNTTQIRIMFFVLLGGFLILLLKLWAYYITDSMALKSDALESLINILTGSFALFSLFFGNRPADKNHPYGHGKIEYFSAFFEGGLILLASILIVYEGFEKLYLGIHLKEITEGLLINFIAGSINGIMGYVLILKGKKIQFSSTSSRWSSFNDRFLHYHQYFFRIINRLFYGYCLARSCYSYIDGFLSYVYWNYDNDQIYE